MGSENRASNVFPSARVAPRSAGGVVSAGAVPVKLAEKGAVRKFPVRSRTPLAVRVYMVFCCGAVARFTLENITGSLDADSTASHETPLEII